MRPELTNTGLLAYHTNHDTKQDGPGQALAYL